MIWIDHFCDYIQTTSIVTSADPDHLDIFYGDESSILPGFSEFLKLIDKKGKLLYPEDAALKLEESKECQKVKNKNLRAWICCYFRSRISGQRGESFIFDDGDEKQTIN